ncbi:winged helix-turn-helix domain-containing protein [Kitasatospora sp. NPDC002227]|uniref:ArsR/SmtB family transcription factor n=1 Tax=Kitasatospora sp. NPDC002227 TaxID=3154773 RepID=UPI003329624E
MLELRFGVADMARTTFTVSAMDQLLGGLASAEHHCVSGSLRRERWWRRVRPQIPLRAAPLLDLVNASPEGIPDFLSSRSGPDSRGLDDELDAMLALPDGRIRADLAFYGDGPGLPRIVQDLREQGAQALRPVAEAARAVFRSCLAPDWSDIRHRLGADVAQRARGAAENGTGSMLTGLQPGAHWQGDEVLRLATVWDARWQLGGRGVELRPNLFLNTLTAMEQDDGAVVLMYPGCSRPQPPAAAVDGLALLLGPSRARSLRAVGHGPCTTAQLADRVGLSPGSASEHATALRVAGIITTEREGRQVRHELTPLGHDLLLHNPA